MMFTALLLLSALSLLVFAQSNTTQSKPKITIDPRQRFQTVDGFGISEAFQCALQIQRLPPTSQKWVLDLLFNTTTGAGLTILRNGIGSSNSSIKDYMNTIEPVSPGFPTSAPNYTWDGIDSGQVWLSKQAMGYGVTTFYADAWSAPAFMKTNNNDTDGGLLCGVSDTEVCDTGDWRQAYADYLVQYIRFYQQAGIKLTHVGFLNEPELPQPYASMVSDGAQAARFLEVFGPTIRKSGLDIKIVCCESAGWEGQREIQADIQAAGAEKLMDVVAAHGYSTPPTDPIDTPLPVWQTEWAELYDNGTLLWDANGDDGEGLQWAIRIQDAFVRSNVTAFLHWQGAENGPYNSALINLDEKNGTVAVSKRLWAFAGFSRFVRPGAVRIGATGDEDQITASAFKNAGGNIAIQLINNGDANAIVDIVIAGSNNTGRLTSWQTDNAYDLKDRGDENFSGGRFSQSVPSRSLVSVLVY